MPIDKEKLKKTIRKSIIKIMKNGKLRTKRSGTASKDLIKNERLSKSGFTSI